MYSYSWHTLNSIKVRTTFHNFNYSKIWALPSNHKTLTNNIIISSVYNRFSDRAGLPPHRMSSPGVLMKRIGADLLRPDDFPMSNT